MPLLSQALFVRQLGGWLEQWLHSSLIQMSFFFFFMGAGERTRDPSGGHKATPDGVTSHITPERSAQKPRNVWGCLEEGSPHRRCRGLKRSRGPGTRRPYCGESGGRPQAQETGA